MGSGEGWWRRLWRWLSGGEEAASEEEAEYPFDGPCHVALRLNGRPVAIQLRTGIGANVMTTAQAAKLGLADSAQPVGRGTLAEFGPLEGDWVPATGLLKDVRVEVAGKDVLQDFLVGAPPKPYDKVAMDVRVEVAGKDVLQDFLVGAPPKPYDKVAMVRALLSPASEVPATGLLKDVRVEVAGKDVLQDFLVGAPPKPYDKVAMVRALLSPASEVPATGLLKDVRVEVAGKEVLQDFLVGAPPKPYDKVAMVRALLSPASEVPATGLLKDVRVEVAGKDVLQDFLVGAPPKPYDKVAMVKMGCVGMRALRTTFSASPTTESFDITINGVEVESGWYRFAARKAKEL